MRERESESERGFWEFEVNAPTESLEANKATKSDGNSIYIYIVVVSN